MKVIINLQYYIILGGICVFNFYFWGIFQYFFQGFTSSEETRKGGIKQHYSHNGVDVSLTNSNYKGFFLPFVKYI